MSGPSRRAPEYASQWRLWAVLLSGLAFALGLAPARAADREGVALALVLDTSGSMRQPVRNAAGQLEPKYLIGNRALEAIVQEVQRFVTNAPADASRKLNAGLFIFSGSGVSEAVKFGPFSAPAIQTWLKNYAGPTSGTPLGKAVDAASRAVLASGLTQKHVLVITDGMNNTGPAPELVISKLQKDASAKETVVFTHFVAFDVDAKVFAPLKKLGATVVSASDEKQLQSQLEFVLEEKILLEKDTPRK